MDLWQNTDSDLRGTPPFCLTSASYLAPTRYASPVLVRSPGKPSSAVPIAPSLSKTFEYETRKTRRPSVPCLGFISLFTSRGSGPLLRYESLRITAGRRTALGGLRDPRHTDLYSFALRDQYVLTWAALLLLAHRGHATASQTQRSLLGRR